MVIRGMKDKDPLAVELGRRGGKKSGEVRAKSMSPYQRSAVASYAAKKRWGHKGNIYLPAESSWLEKARGAVELLDYHDSVCPDYPLAQWFRDVLRLNERWEK
jgi:hypothetical protein